MAEDVNFLINFDKNYLKYEGEGLITPLAMPQVIVAIILLDNVDLEQCFSTFSIPLLYNN